MKTITAFFIMWFWGISSYATEKTFTFITESQPPYAADDIEDRGWAWVVVKAAVESQGYTAQLDIVPWARAVYESKIGRADALFLAFWTEERLQWYEYTVPVAKVKSGLFKLKERQDLVFDGDLNALSSFDFGVCNGCAIATHFDNAEYLKKKFLVDTQQGLRMLWLKRLDFVAANKPTADSDLNKLEAEYPGISNQVVFIEPALQVNDLLVAISKETPNYKEKLRDFNRGMKEIFLNGTYHRIQKKYGFKQ